MTARTATRTTFALTALVAASLGLAACGGSPAGAYYGTAGDTLLIIDKDGTCQYTEDYEEGEKPDPEDFEECRWTNTEATYTFVGLVDETIVGTMSEDGALALPDQPGWNGEIYSPE